MDIQNVEACKELVKTYRSLTLLQLTKRWFGNGNNTLMRITGFGTSSCILCESCEICYYCIHCVNNEETSCSSGVARDTFYAMKNAVTPQELLDAVNKRADYLEQLISEYEGLK